MMSRYGSLNSLLSAYRFFNRRKKHGFTLIELLIVIAIILILIAIALPNFLEAQIRAKVTKAKGEIRTLATAMQAYYLDWNVYPPYSFQNYSAPTTTHSQAGLTWLTSPIAYIKSLPEDPFPGDLNSESGEPLQGPPYSYVLDGYEITAQEVLSLHPHSGIAFGGNLVSWAIFSAGPDTPVQEAVVSHLATPLCNGGGCNTPISSYSPTNGTRSKGDLFMYGGDKRWMGVQVERTVADRAKYATYLKPGQIVDGVRYLGTFPPHLSQF